MNKHPADEYQQDMAADRFYGERDWNPLESDFIASYTPERQGQLLPLELPWLKTKLTTKKSSGLSGAMGGFWITTIGLVVGAFVGVEVAGIVGLLIGAWLGTWIVARLGQVR